MHIYYFWAPIFKILAMTFRWMLALLPALFYVPVFAATDSSSFATAIMSEATDIPIHGWNRVLMLRNGKTVVLHLAPREKMIVKIFDEAHKEVASIAQYFKIIGEADLKESQFKGFYDIGGVPTLFMEQVIDGHNALLRIRFNPETGKLTDEKIVREANKYEVFYVSKMPNGDEYAVFCHKTENLADKLKDGLTVLHFDGKHEKIRESTFIVPLARFDALFFKAFEFNKTGTYVALDCRVQEKDGLYQEILLLGKLFDGEMKFNVQQIKLQVGFSPNHVFFCFNEFSSIINVAFCAYAQTQVRTKKGFSEFKDQFVSYTGVLEPDMTIRSFAPLVYSEANRFLALNKDSASKFRGVPLRMYTNKFGVTTILSENDKWVRSFEGAYTERTLMGDICLTKIDDEGKETSGIVVPKQQSLMNLLYPEELVWRKTTKYLFRDYQEQADDNQFASVECLSNRNDNYLFFNDYVSNEGKTLKDKRDNVLYYEKAEAICYKVNGNDEIERQYLFGKPGTDESRALLLESMDQQADDKKLSALVCVRKGKEKRLHLAWCTLN